MGIMDKFSAVEIKTDNRISEADRAFCQRQQDAFDKSGPALQRIADVMMSAQSEQRGILAASQEFYNSYITTDSFCCNEDAVYKAMTERNKTFIFAIVGYFAKSYKVELDKREIMEHLIPAAPQEPKLPWGGYRNMTDDEIDTFKKELNDHKAKVCEYEKCLRSLPLRYEQVVDEIFVQLGGFSFQEQSMNEFLDRTWKCCHSSWNGDKETFEIKNDVLRLPNGCHCDENKWMTYPEPRYELTDDSKTLLDALAYFECGRMDKGRLWFPDLCGYSKTTENFFEIHNMGKIKSIKLFKNGRVDIKFRNATYLQEFAEQYMRRRVS